MEAHSYLKLAVPYTITQLSETILAFFEESKDQDLSA